VTCHRRKDRVRQEGKQGRKEQERKQTKNKREKKKRGNSNSPHVTAHPFD
jgi:hypothetical protein